MKQSQAGTITFFSAKGEYLYERNYHRLCQRREILDYARRIYGKGFSTMYYQISPTLKQRLLDKIELPDNIQSIHKTKAA